MAVTRIFSTRGEGMASAAGRSKPPGKGFANHDVPFAFAAK
jgi:hypothetical protein